MPDAFRGLTIRLGADARPLTSALASISSSASQAQKQLSAMNKALQFDATNAQALQTRIGLAGDKAMLAARAFNKIETAASQVSKKVKQLERSNEYAYASTQKMRDGYNHVNAELQHIYDGVKKVYAEEKNLAIDSEEVAEHIKQLRDNYKGSSAKAKELTAEMKTLVAKAASLDKLVDKFDLGGVAADGKALVGIFDKLRTAHNKFQKQLKTAEDVEGFRAMKTQLVAYEAELEKASSEVVRFKSEMYSMAGTENLSRLKGDLEGVRAASEKARTSASTMSTAFDALPRSMAAAQAKFNSMQNAEQALNAELSRTKRIINEIGNTPGFDKQAAMTKDVWANLARVESEARKLDKEYRQLQASAETLRDKLKETKDFAGQSSLSEYEYEKLQKELTATEAKLKNVKSAMIATDKALESANLEKEFREAREEAVRLNAEIARLRTASSALTRLRETFGTLRTMGYGLYSTVTPAILIAGRYAIQSARDIDAAYRDMRKTVNGTEEQFEHLHEAALEFSKTHVTSAEKILEIEAMGGQLGIAADNLEAFAETVSNLDVATNIDADAAAEQLGKMATVLGINVDQYDEFGDALVRLGNNMPVMESDILTLTTRFMGMGKVVGMQPDQMLAWAAAASATGQKAEAAGSAMQRFISKMETAVVGGGDTLAQWAEVAGMSADEFATAFGENASEAMYKFIEGLGRIQSEGGSVNQVLQDLKINNVRDKQLLEGLAVQMANAGESTSVLRDALDMASTAYHGLSYQTKDGAIELAGDAAREAGKKAQGFSGQIEMMVHNAQILSQEVAKGALPYVQALSAAFGELTDTVKNMPDWQKTFAIGAAGVTAMAGPAAIGIGAIGTAVTSFIDIGDRMAQSKTWSKVTGLNKTLAKELQYSSSVIERTLETNRKSALNMKTWNLAVEGLANVSWSKVIAGGAAAAAIFYTVGKSIEYDQKRIEDNRLATEKLYTTITGLPQVYDKTASSFKAVSEEIKPLHTYYNEVTASTARMAEGIQERNRAAQTEISTLESARSVINEYMGQTDLSAEQQGRLIAAIDMVNSVCGTQYRVVDATRGAIADQTGAILDNCDAINKQIAAMQQQIQQEAIMQDMADVTAQKSILRQEKAKAYAERAAAQAQRDALGSQAQYEGSADYEEWVKLGNTIKYNTDVIEGYNKQIGMLSESEQVLAEKMSATNKAAKGASLSLKETVQVSDAWRDAFSGTEQGDAQFKKFYESIAATNLSIDEFKNISEDKMFDIAAAFNENGGNIVAALDSVGISVHSLSEQFVSEMDAAQEKSGAFEGVASTFGETVDSMAAKLNGAGVSAQSFASLTEEQLSTAIEESEGNVESFVSKIAEMSNVKAETKVVAETAEAQQAIDEYNESLDEANSKEVNTDVENDADDEQEVVDSYSDSLDDVPESVETTVVLHADGVASTLKEINDYISNISGVHDVTVNVSENRGGMASGGIVGGVLRRAPKNASGGALNGIVTRAIMTNRGWVGEAGAEAVFHMRNAGGAIVPLSNRQYVRPFARAVASEMGGGRRSVTNNISITLDYQAGDDAATLARGLMRELENVMSMEA